MRSLVINILRSALCIKYVPEDIYLLNYSAVKSVWKKLKVRPERNGNVSCF